MKKIIKILLVCLIIAGIVVVLKLGFKVGLKYSENTQIDVNIGKDFEVKDIQSITKEVFPKQEVIIQQVELYKDMAQITVKDASDDQLNQLNTKINEKYGLEHKVSDLTVTKNTNTRLRNIAKPYILPLSIATAIILVYLLIRFRKLGIWKTIYKSLLIILAPQAILFSLYAVTRFPINQFTAILSIIIYIVSSLAIMTILPSLQLHSDHQN